MGPWLSHLRFVASGQRDLALAKQFSVMTWTLFALSMSDFSGHRAGIPGSVLGFAVGALCGTILTFLTHSLFLKLARR